MPATRQRRKRQRVAFADFLVIARRHRGLTQQNLADLANVDRATIVRWESGAVTAVPDEDSLRAACSALNVRYLDALLALGTVTDAELAQVA